MVTAALSGGEELEKDSDSSREKFCGTLTIPFKNENLYVEHTTPDGHITVPIHWNLSPRHHTDILAYRC